MPALLPLAATSNVERIEAPLTWAAYFMCIFASFGGIIMGYDVGYISSVMQMPWFIHVFGGVPYPPSLPSQTFYLPAGMQAELNAVLPGVALTTALQAGDMADFAGRKTVLLVGSLVMMIGTAIQVGATESTTFIMGRAMDGAGLGMISAIVILYITEVAPRKIRGTTLALYQWFIVAGQLLAACVTYATQNRRDPTCFQIPVAVQFVWIGIFVIGISILPDSPRYYVKRGKVNKASRSLAHLRGQTVNSEPVQQELTEIIANHEYELSLVPQRTYWASWGNIFKGSWKDSSSNWRRFLLGSGIQMFSQITGIALVTFYSTSFFETLQTVQNPFLMSLVNYVVTVAVTPISFWAIESLGRRKLLMIGAGGMAIFQLACAVVGTASGWMSYYDWEIAKFVDHSNPSNFDKPSISAMIALICIMTAFYSSSWGPAAWVITSEAFPLPIRAKGISLSVGSYWVWSLALNTITPFLTQPIYADLGPKVFFIFGPICCIAVLYVYYVVPETKGLSLEQVDKMFEETIPRESSKWKPHETFASQMGMTDDGFLREEIVYDLERKASRIH